jgi:hydroxymethylpyrimidine pyrophosphatase-like HAD family hydrolase
MTNAKRIVSFGDGLNDLDLFSISDECYAVENAHEDLKKKATEVIGKNDEDAVTLWLLKNAFRT